MKDLSTPGARCHRLFVVDQTCIVKVEEDENSHPGRRWRVIMTQEGDRYSDGSLSFAPSLEEAVVFAEKEHYRMADREHKWDERG